MKILLDAGHGVNTPGKKSPDGSLREYKWAREMATLVKEKLLAQNYDVTYICEGIEEDTSLKERCKLINSYCKKLGSKNCLSVSIHINAAASDKQWHTATGYSVYVSPNCSENSKKLAKSIYAEAKKAGLQGNRSVPKEGYWTMNLAMCRDTNCPAVLVENLFMDNKDNCEYLKSKEGKEIIANLLTEGIKNYIKIS